MLINLSNTNVVKKRLKCFVFEFIKWLSFKILHHRTSSIKNFWDTLYILHIMFFVFFIDIILMWGMDQEQFQIVHIKALQIFIPIFLRFLVLLGNQHHFQISDILLYWKIQDHSILFFPLSWDKKCIQASWKRIACICQLNFERWSQKNYLTTIKLLNYHLYIDCFSLFYIENLV